jgi:crotonobetainyl-CoA:carnitine CoA-transferase CaiB-like acyl-CoA transferase
MTFPQSLHGIRVLDLSLNLAGPFAGQILADLGATVIKVERPGAGDPARAWAPPAWGGEGTLFLCANRGKKSLALELDSDEGRERLHGLLAYSDVLIQAFRPDVAERFGLTEALLRPRYPRLIFCDVVAFNPESEAAGRPGYDPLLQAHAGLLSVTGMRGGEPVRVGTSVVDLGTGMWGALGILAALRSRDQDGHGAHVRISLEDTAMTWMGYHLQSALATGQTPEPMGTGLGMICPYGAFPTSDGSLMIAAANNALFQRLCGALGLDALAGDPELQTNPGRVAHRDRVEAAVSAATRAFTRQTLEGLLVEAGVPCAQVRTALEVAQDPTVQASFLRAEPHPEIDDYRAPALPVVIRGGRAPAGSPPPSVGKHSEAILTALGDGSDPWALFMES